MAGNKRYRLLTYGIAAVWFVNGFFCKVLNWVPRHQQIVARIMGMAYSPELTVLIGCAEIVMAIWILSGYRSKPCATIQMSVVVTMNLIEFVFASDLLLWGRLNILFACIFVALIGYHEFMLRPNSNPLANS